MELAIFNKISAADSPLHRLDGRIKTVLFLGSIVVATMLTHWYLVAGFWMVSIASFSILHLSWSNLFRRLVIPFGIAWLVLLNLIFTNGSHAVFVISIGTISLTAYREGLQLGILILLRIMTAVTLATLLSFSTPMIEIMETLRICKVPGIMVDMAAMMYRYVFIIEETAHNMRCAQLSRMGDSISWLQQARDTGKIAGYVLTKSLDRSIKIYNAMLSRGYNENSTGAEFFIDPIPASDWRTGILIAGLPVALAIINIMI